MNRALEAAYRGYTNVLSITDVGRIQNRAWAYQHDLARELGKGVNGFSPFLQEQAREVGRYFFDVDWLEMPDRLSSLPGTDIKVAGIGLFIPKIFRNSIMPASLTQPEYGIQVNLEDGGNEIQLQVFPDDFTYDRWKASYRDSSFDSSQRSYLPHRDALHPPFVSTFQKARDVLIGIAERAVVALIMDAAFRAVYGDDKGFTNKEEFEVIVGKSLWAQGLKKKAFIPYPPGIYHQELYTLFEKIQNGKQKDESTTEKETPIYYTDVMLQAGRVED